MNACELLPVEKYLLGAVLPPHLSPFVNEGKTQVYVPPEEKMLKDPNYKPVVSDNDSSDDSDESQSDMKIIEQPDADEQTQENELNEENNGESSDSSSNKLHQKDSKDRVFIEIYLFI